MLTIQIAAFLFVVGVILGLGNRLLPMNAATRTILNADLAICVAWWLLTIFGLLRPLAGIRIGA